MKTADLDYDLPESRIAQRPLGTRSASRLLVVDRKSGDIRHLHFTDLPALLDPGDVMVRNVSRVIPARLRATRNTGGNVEFLLTSRVAENRWLTLARPAKRLTHNEEVELAHGGSVCISKETKGTEIQITIFGHDLDAYITKHGEIPLPPYIRRAPDENDRERYQTTFSETPGSSAAPTAGLHFDEAIDNGLVERGVHLHDALLHIGPGTFLPIRTEALEDHPMHREYFEIPATTATAVRSALADGRRSIAVGTTVVRSLESAAALNNPLVAASGETKLFIRPGYQFSSVNTLLTNFHQPRSTLLSLVAAFIGLELMHRVYDEALEKKYRFLSYGDAMLAL